MARGNYSPQAGGRYSGILPLLFPGESDALHLWTLVNECYLVQSGTGEMEGAG